MPGQGGFDLPAVPDLDPARRDYRPIAEYGFIGDGHGSALIAPDGSIDWACLERFDAPPIFSRLLDRRRGGFFQIRPAASCRVERRYAEATKTLETRFTTPGGAVLLRDALVHGPEAEGFDRLFRGLLGLRGEVVLLLRYQPLRGFATEFPALSAGAGPVAMAGGPWLHGAAGWQPDGQGLVATLRLASGGQQDFVLTPQAEDRPECFAALQAASEARWHGWSRQGRYTGRWEAMVRRSAMVLKALTYRPTGALVAAPTTSLPEEIGGVRNWDYRYCWLRDACLSFYALKKYGQLQEAEAFLGFIRRLPHRPGQPLPPLFDLEGRTELAEAEIAHFEGYRGSRPVRTGNEAAQQHQYDVYGQVLDLLHLHRALGGELDAALTGIGTSMADLVAASWREPDAGLWEPRLEPQRYVHAAMMNWVALDRAIRLFGDRPHWVAERDAILEAVRSQGVHREGHLTQVMGGEAVDAALLLAPMLGFPLGRAVLARTVDRVIAELGEGPLVHRYRHEDGLPGQEGGFVLCAFWLVDALLVLDRVEEARARFDALLAMANDLGLYAEEMDADGSFLGNFPQAFSHLGLIHSALLMDLYEEGGSAALRGSYADRALRETARRRTAARGGPALSPAPPAPR